MIKVSGKTRIVLIVVCVLLIIAGMWMMFFSEKHPSPSSALSKANPMFQRNVKTLKLKGKVRSIKGSNYTQSVQDDEFDDVIAYQNLEFDKSGNVTRLIVYNRHDELVIDEVYAYDGAGNYISRSSDNVQGLFVLKESFRFDEEGRLLETLQEVGGRKMRYVYEYKDTVSGYIQKKFQVDSSLHRLVRKHVFDTVKHEQYVEQVSQDGKRQSLHSRYDKRGNMIEETRFDSIGAPVYHYVASFNTNNLVVREAYSIRGETEHYHAYDEHGSEIEYTRIENGDIDPRSYRAVYKYDTNDNWIHCDMLRLDGTPKTSVDRVIEYY